MNVNELVANAKAADPGLSSIPDARATALVREVLRQIGKQLEDTADGKVGVVGFGSFRVKPVEREKDGQKVVGKRVTFRASEAKGISPELKKARAAKKAVKKAAKGKGAAAQK